MCVFTRSACSAARQGRPWHSDAWLTLAHDLSFWAPDMMLGFQQGMWRLLEARYATCSKEDTVLSRPRNPPPHEQVRWN